VRRGLHLTPAHHGGPAAKEPCRRQEPGDQAVCVRRNYSLTNTKLSAKHNHPAQYLQPIAVMARSGGSKGWEGEGGSPAATWPSSTSLVMPLLARQSPTVLQATHPPRLGESEIATSHLFQDAPRDDDYYWMGGRETSLSGFVSPTQTGSFLRRDPCPDPAQAGSGGQGLRRATAGGVV